MLQKIKQYQRFLGILIDSETIKRGVDLSKNKYVIVLFVLMLMACFYINTTICVAQNIPNPIDTSFKQNNFVFDLELSSRQHDDSVQFNVNNLLPGDSVEQKYNVTVFCKGDVTVNFKSSVGENQKLAEVMRVKIIFKETGETLYDGLIGEMTNSIPFKIFTDKSIAQKLEYVIVFSLDKSAGNEYMNQTLDVDFEWWVDEIDNLDIPKTGDNANILLWIIIMTLSAFGILILIIIKKEECKCKEKKTLTKE